MRAGHVLFAGSAVLLLGGGYRLVHIERSQGDWLRDEAARQHTATWTVPAQRGDILDCNGRVLAGSVRRPSVFMDPALINDPHSAAQIVAPTLGIDSGELEQLILANKHRRFVWVKRGLADEELEAFSRLRRAEKLRAFVVRYEPTRVYPFGRLASHVLGFVGADQNGLAGVELSFDHVLTGEDGRGSSTVDVRRRRVRSEAGSYLPPRDGASVVLTIDSHIQQRTEHHLQNAFEEFRPQWASAIVIDPQSGEVLAMATLPDFDPAEPIPPGLSEADREAAVELLRNRAISDSYEPGSIFKPFIAGPALEAGIVQMDEPFEVNGPVRQFGRRTIHDTHTYGTLALHQVISKSSNIGMGFVGARCGNDRLNEFVRRFGFGEATGIRLPGEHAGLVQSLPRWTNYSTQSIAIGQEIAATQIQLVTAFSVFCNDGILYRPRIVRGVISETGETSEDNSNPIAIRRVLPSALVREFRKRALVEVVTDGTGKRAQLEGYQVFGKTGTAQVAQPDGRGYLPDEHVGSFVGGAPAEHPRVLVLVSIYRPSGSRYYGGTVATPAVREIIADTLDYMQVPPDPSRVDPPPAERDQAGTSGAYAQAW